MEKLGGMPWYGIPEYRLSEKQYQWDIDGVLELGVTAHTGVKLGEDFTIRSLKAMGFDAIYLALGCWSGRLLPFEGKELAGIYSGIDYLRRFHTDEEIIRAKTISLSAPATWPWTVPALPCAPERRASICCFGSHAI